MAEVGKLGIDSACCTESKMILKINYFYQFIIKNSQLPLFQKLNEAVSCLLARHMGKTNYINDTFSYQFYLLFILLHSLISMQYFDDVCLLSFCCTAVQSFCKLCFGCALCQIGLGESDNINPRSSGFTVLQSWLELSKTFQCQSHCSFICLVGRSLDRCEHF